jgi:2-dehydropantoate 2-reductase
VVYPAAEIEAPGIIRHIEGNRFTVGEIDGARTERIAAVSETLARAGFKAPIAGDIRAEIWTKLWGNMSLNPISALTHATLEDICRFGLTRSLVAEIMREAQTVGEHFGVRFRISIEKRIAGAEAVGAHKTSMLQDIESGRPIEADALIGSVIELARLAGVATPHLDTAYALVKLLGDTLARAKGRLVVSV